jgi:hypothetical protein
MVKAPRRSLVVAALAVGALVVAFWSRGGLAPAPALEPVPASGSRAAEQALPRIGLDRLASPAPEPPSAERDVFRFGRPSPPPAPAAPVQAAAASPVPVADAAPLAPSTTTLPPFGVKFVGVVEKQGLKVAVLLSDERKETLTGREGEVVANRLRIVRIGIESVEVQDVGSDRVRRIPLKGN